MLYAGASSVVSPGFYGALGVRLVREGQDMTAPDDVHAPCRALMGHFRRTLASIADLTVQHQGQSPAQDVYERAQEALQVESGREAEEELQLLWTIMHHADELYRPWPWQTPAQRQEHIVSLLEALAAYAAFRTPRMWWEGRP
jgi:hypothetical protein